MAYMKFLRQLAKQYYFEARYDNEQVQTIRMALRVDSSGLLPCVAETT